MLKHWLHQNINKCWNIGLKGCKMASQMQWYPFFQSWGQYKAIKSSAFTSNLEQIENTFFLFQPWLLVWSPWGWFPTFAPIGIAWFELNIGLDSYYKKDSLMRSIWSNPNAWKCRDKHPYVCDCILKSPSFWSIVVDPLVI
jgi:hypothetical protein